MADDATRPCPCGAQTTDGAPSSYREHCQPIHQGRPAATAEALMRSRYSAHALGLTAHLSASWDPTTRPDEIEPQPDIVWTGLEIIESQRGGALDGDGTVEFIARYRRRHPDRPASDGELHEISRFRRAGLGWLYVDGSHPL